MSQIRTLIRFSQARKRAEERQRHLISAAWCVAVVALAYVFICLQYYVQAGF